MTQEELTEMYRRFGHLVFVRCHSILRDEAEAKDVLQDVFVRAIRYHRSFDRSECPLGWLYRTSERCCFDRLKKRKRVVTLMPDMLSQVSRDGIPSSTIEAREVVLAFLERFDRKVQQVAVLYYLDGLSQEEIAKELRWSRRTVGKKITFIRERARALAQTYAVVPRGDGL